MIKKDPKKIIRDTILENLDKSENFKVFLFGSRVMGNYRENSDYDIGIIGKRRLNFIKLLRIKSKLAELPYLVDLVDFNNVSDDFKSLALKKIEKWN